MLPHLIVAEPTFAEPCAASGAASASAPIRKEGRKESLSCFASAQHVAQDVRRQRDMATSVRCIDDHLRPRRSRSRASLRRPCRCEAGDSRSRAFTPAQPGTLDRYLVERHALHAQRHRTPRAGTRRAGSSPARSRPARDTGTRARARWSGGSALPRSDRRRGSGGRSLRRRRHRAARPSR